MVVSSSNKIDININIKISSAETSDAQAIEVDASSPLNRINPQPEGNTPNPKLYVARSWMHQWDADKASTALENSDSLFFQRMENTGEYTPAKNFHFNNLILGGKFPAAVDTLGGLPASETAVMDVLDPDVQKVDHVHVEGVSQVLIDINVMTHEEAGYLRGKKGIDHVIQSNIGGPNMRAGSLLEAGKMWIEGEAPGCSCLICSRVPDVVAKLEENKPLSPSDVLPLTTIPRLHDVVDTMLKPKVKIAMGSQGRISEALYQDYPSAAVGHESYSISKNSKPDVTPVGPELDPRGIVAQPKAPKGYIYTSGFLWENGKDMIRQSGDPDRHAFGFIYLREDQVFQRVKSQTKDMFAPRTSLS